MTPEDAKPYDYWMRTESGSPSDTFIKEILGSPTTSHWLKDAVLANLRRDCVDALNDIDMLSRCMRLRFDEINAATNSQTISEVTPKNV